MRNKESFYKRVTTAFIAKHEMNRYSFFYDFADLKEVFPQSAPHSSNIETYGIDFVYNWNWR